MIQVQKVSQNEFALAVVRNFWFVPKLFGTRPNNKWNSFNAYKAGHGVHTWCDSERFDYE